jgi:hypothetical protein
MNLDPENIKVTASANFTEKLVIEMSPERTTGKSKKGGSTT